MTTDLSKNEVWMTRDLETMDVSVQKRTAVAAVLNFTDKEWESLKALKEADAAERSQVAIANEFSHIIGELGTENETAGGTIDKGAV